jgi:hypothetical protein
LIRAISRMSSKTKMDIPTYEGSLNAEELLDWIRALDTYFDYEDIEEDKKVRHAVTKLKGHAALWWDELQADRRSKGKQKIKELGSDDRQDEGEVHSEGLPDHSVQAHAEPETEVDDGEGVHRRVLQAQHSSWSSGSDDEKVARYLNGLRYDIQDELSMLTIRTVEDAYQMALKAKKS